MTSTLAHRRPTDRSISSAASTASESPVTAASGVATVSPIDGNDSRLGPPVEQATELLAGMVDRLDPSRLTGPAAVRLYELVVGLDRLTMAAKTLLAPRIEESGVWRDSGHRSTAAMLADLEGVPTGQARNTLDVGQRLAQLPATEEALRRGVLSGPKVAELSGAAILHPAGEATMLEGAAEEPLHLLKERCQRFRATSATNDPVAAVRRIHTDRYFTWSTDPEGAFCFFGRDTADRGAKIIQQMNYTSGRLKKAEERPDDPGAERTTEGNRRADAFFLLMTGGSPEPDADLHSSPVSLTDSGDDSDPGPPTEQIAAQWELVPGKGQRGQNPQVGERPPDPAPRPRSRGSGHEAVIDRPPTCSIVVRVDLDALLRGAVLPGEVCEIANQGPIPVAMARAMASDSYLRFVFHKAGDIRSISHSGRTINLHLRTALAERDKGRCVVPGCGVSYGLEIDHTQGFADGGPTELANLALLCHHHHYLKSYEGWTLERNDTKPDGSIIWSFTPMPAFGQEPDPLSG